MSRSIYVPLPDPEHEALRALADRERRRPKEQAGLLITEGLHRRGLLADDSPEPGTGVLCSPAGCHTDEAAQ